MLAFFKYSKKEEKFMSDDTVIEEEKEENIIKKICREHNLTYKKLAEEIGYGHGSIQNLANKENNDISIMVKKVLELFILTKKQAQELDELNIIKRWIRAIST
jgi:transcriptional regulator with XRE-family HTH domain